MYNNRKPWETGFVFDIMNQEQSPLGPYSIDNNNQTTDDVASAALTGLDVAAPGIGTIIGAGIKGADMINDVFYNMRDPIGNTQLQDQAIRGTAEDHHVINKLTNGIVGLFGGETIDDKRMKVAEREARTMGKDFSGYQNIDNLANAWNQANVPQMIESSSIDLIEQSKIDRLNDVLKREYRDTFNNYQDTLSSIGRNDIRRNLMSTNYAAEGGYMEGLNGVNKINEGGTHGQNPYEGVQLGIAPDGLPNLVEENEVVWENYVFSNRLKPSKKLLKDNLIPEKYAGLTFAKIADKLQQESEDRPNDPVSLQTLNDWMTRLQSAQETHKMNLEDNSINKALGKMDLGQDMFAKGGKIYINPKNRGKFNATKKRTGKTTEELTHSKNPLTRKRAIFAQNARKWAHKGAWGLSLDEPPIESLYIHPSLRDVEINALKPREDISRIQTNNPYDIYNTLLNTEPKINNINLGTGYLDEAIEKEANRNAPISFGDLRYAPAIGAGLSAIQASIQNRDYELANRLRELAGQYKEKAAPHLGNYRRYNPVDVNLGDAENLALEAAVLRANRGQNRATQAAVNAATINAFQKANAQRNLAAQQANEANRQAVDTFNLGVDQTNANMDYYYDNMNTAINDKRLAMLSAAAQAQDASNAAWAQMYNATHENLYNQLGNVGKDEWAKNQRDWLLNAIGREGILELIKSGYFNK